MFSKISIILISLLLTERRRIKLESLSTNNIIINFYYYYIRRFKKYYISKGSDYYLNYIVVGISYYITLLNINKQKRLKKERKKLRL